MNDPKIADWHVNNKSRYASDTDYWIGSPSRGYLFSLPSKEQAENMVDKLNSDAKAHKIQKKLAQIRETP